MSLEQWAYAPAVEPDDLQNFQYMELRDSGKESYSPGAATANRTFMVNWLYRPDFLDALLGYSYLDANNKVHRIVPDVHPEIDNFYAEDATVEGMGVLGKNDNNAISWTNAKVNANYKPRDYAVLKDGQVSSEIDRYTTRTFAYSADYLTINGAMKFVTSQRVLSAPPGRLTAAMELTYIWHEVPAKPQNPFQIPNLVAIAACIGKINSVNFDLNGGNYPPGTVLFVGVDPKMITGKLAEDTATNPAGNYHWEITMKFLYRNNGFNQASSSSASSGGGSIVTGYAGHNWIFDIASNRWDLVTADGTASGPTIYQSADLNTLWTIS